MGEQEVHTVKNKQCKYIFVTGGVLSGVGKGITAASLGAIIKAKGYNVTIQKCDPYLNVDARWIDPTEHGERFVTHDGAVTDLDLGHYERFLDIETNKYSTALAGSIYKELIDRERGGGFNGKTVQVMPHFTDLVQARIERSSRGSDVHIVEIGGTVGDYESLAFVEAIRLFGNRVGRKNCLYINVVYVPWINTSKELKTKPAQNALKDLRGFGIIPDVVCVRTEKPAPREICEKIAVFSGISSNAVVNLPDTESVYDVPFNVLKSGVLNILNEFLGDRREPDMSKWQEFSECRAKKYRKTVRVGLVAKDEGSADMHLSINEALKAAAAWNEVNIEINYIDPEKYTKRDLVAVHGLIMPDSNRTNGAEGRIKIANYALENNKPYLGIAAGLSVAVVAAARRGGLKRAISEEFVENIRENVVYKVSRPKETDGTERLGDFVVNLEEESLVAEIYGEKQVVERHHSAYEVNKDFLEEIEEGGLKVSGWSERGNFVEFVEAPKHKFFVATQGHPEFKSRPLRVHPLFMNFLKSLR